MEQLPHVSKPYRRLNTYTYTSRMTASLNLELSDVAMIDQQTVVYYQLMFERTGLAASFIFFPVGDEAI